MKQVIRFIDLLSATEGVLVDMEYTDVDNKIKVENLNVHNIINGTVGQVIEINPFISSSFALYLVNFLESNKQQ